MFAVQMLANTLVNGIQCGEIIALQGNSLGNPAELKTILHLSHTSHNVQSINHPARQQAIAEAVSNSAHNDYDQLALFD